MRHRCSTLRGRGATTEEEEKGSKGTCNKRHPVNVKIEQEVTDRTEDLELAVTEEASQGGG